MEGWHLYWTLKNGQASSAKVEEGHCKQKGPKGREPEGCAGDGKVPDVAWMLFSQGKNK